MQGKYFFATCCLACTLSIAISIKNLGSCSNNFADLENIDIEKFPGIWYELEAPIFSVATTKKCSYYRVIWTDENIHQATYVTYDGLFGIKSNQSYPVTIVNSELAQPDGVKKDYILGTDYDNYAVYYHCENSTLGLFSEVQVRVLGRNRSLDDASQRAADAVLKKYGFGGIFVKINQKNCPAPDD